MVDPGLQARSGAKPGKSFETRAAASWSDGGYAAKVIFQVNVWPQWRILVLKCPLPGHFGSCILRGSGWPVIMGLLCPDMAAPVPNRETNTLDPVVPWFFEVLMVPAPARESYYQLTKALISLGRSRGFVLVDELNSFLPGSASSPADLENIMSMFNKLGIGVGATEAEALHIPRTARGGGAVRRRSAQVRQGDGDRHRRGRRRQVQRPRPDVPQGDGHRPPAQAGGRSGDRQAHRSGRAQRHARPVPVPPGGEPAHRHRQDAQGEPRQDPRSGRACPTRWTRTRTPRTPRPPSTCTTSSRSCWSTSRPCRICWSSRPPASRCPRSASSDREILAGPGHGQPPDPPAGPQQPRGDPAHRQDHPPPRPGDERRAQAARAAGAPEEPRLRQAEGPLHPRHRAHRSRAGALLHQVRDGERAVPRGFQHAQAGAKASAARPRPS